MESMPSAPSFMIRWLMTSVKYTLPSRSTVGPSVKATVVAISGCWAATGCGVSRKALRIAIVNTSSERSLEVTVSLLLLRPFFYGGRHQRREHFRRRDELPDMTLRVLGRTEQQTDDGGRQL